MRYTATFPLLINVANQPTYFMALKDSAGLVKKFAIIDIQRYQNVAVGDTGRGVSKSSRTLLTNGVDTGDSMPTDVKQAKGIIATMAQAVIEGNSHYYVTLKGDSWILRFPAAGMLRLFPTRLAMRFPSPTSMLAQRHFPLESIDSVKTAGPRAEKR